MAKMALQVKIPLPNLTRAMLTKVGWVHLTRFESTSILKTITFCQLIIYLEVNHTSAPYILIMHTMDIMLTTTKK